MTPKLRHNLTVRGVLGITAVGLMANSQPAQAQQTELDALRAQITELQNRLNKLEQQQTAAATAAKTTGTAVTSRQPVVVSGLLQVNGRGFGNQKGPGANAADTLQLRRGELSVNTTITPRLTGRLMIDPAKNTAATSTSTVVAPPAGSPPGTQPTVTTATTLNQANNPLQEIVLSYQLSKRGNNTNFIDIGQYKVPVGYEGDLISSGNVLTVDRGLIFVTRDPFGGGSGDVRDTGVRLRGTAGPVDYQLGVFNGLGERQNALATGDQKAVVGRLMFSPPSIKGLQFGVSGARGNQRGIPNATNRVSRDLLNLFSVYRQNKLTLQAEYLTGENQLIAAAPGVIRDIQGYYGLIGYAFTPKLEGVLRYDSFDFDKDLPARAGVSNDTTVKDMTLGLNYYIKGNNARIQANIVRRNGGAGLIAGNGFGNNATAFSKSSTQLRTNFQLAF